ncbi:MAG: sulfotransferase [Desulfobacterales bacterium]|nr:sulfotransferase [Desulfobacterales bacterium]
MGPGRSGTTILDILLANNPGIAGCGELNYIFREGFLLNNPCSCGAPCNQCALWGKVREKVGLPEGELLEIFRLFLSIEWHAGFFKLISGLIPRAKLRRYAAINHKLLVAIKSVTRATAMVDSSKLPGRALALAEFFPGKTRIICITRDPAGIMRSFQKTGLEQDPKPPLATCLYYITVLLSCRLVAWRVGSKMIEIRYEELMNDPVACLARLEKWSGLDFSRAKTILANNGDLLPGHIVRGNRLRRKNRIRFKKGIREVALTSIYQKMLVYLMQAARLLLGFKGRP